MRTATTRRRFLAGASAFVTAIPLKAGAAGNACTVAPTVSKVELGAELAVSFREALKAAKSGGSKRFSNLTRIDGVCEDLENKDIIFWGVTERGQPDLHVDDLVVAIRSAFGEYGTEFQPGISLDQEKEQSNNLKGVSLTGVAAKRRFAEVCSQQPQVVRVDSLPRNARITKVLVDADYRMKQVSQGLVQLPVSPPLIGAFERSMEEQRQAVRSGTFSDDRSKRRFWFEPGKFEYSWDSGIASLQSAQVILSEADDSDGADAKNGRQDPASTEFACSWTARMEETFRAEPIWRDMYNVFRHFAIARIIVDQSFISKYHQVFQLLKAHQIDRVELPASLPGLSRWETIEHTSNGSRATYLTRVCGGVSLGLSKRLVGSQVVSANDSSSPTKILFRAITASRPDQLSVSWPVPTIALQDAISWLKNREEAKTRAAIEEEEKEQARSLQTKQGFALLGAFVVGGTLLGWLLNRGGNEDTNTAQSPVLISSEAPTRQYVGIRPNERCPCNSGKRFKNCHGARLAE